MTSTIGTSASTFGSASAQPIDLRHFLPYRIHKLWASISVARSLPTAQGVDLKTREWRVLMILAAFGPMTSAEIAQHSSMDTGSTARAVKALLDAQLLTSRKPKADRRKQVLALTHAGVIAHDDIAAIRTRFSDDALSCLSVAEQQQLFGLLQRIEKHVAELGAPDEWLSDEE